MAVLVLIPYIVSCLLSSLANYTDNIIFMLLMYRSLEVPKEECAAYGQVSVGGDSHYETVGRESAIYDGK